MSNEKVKTVAVEAAPTAPAVPPAPSPAPAPDDDLFTIIVETPLGARLCFDSIHLQHTILDIKGLISERSAVSHITCYHLELIEGGPQKPSPKLLSSGDMKTSNKKSKKKKKKSFPLNDYCELAMAPERMTNYSVLRMVLDNYDLRQARTHVRKLRDILTTSKRPQLPAFVRNYAKAKAEKAEKIEKAKQAELAAAAAAASSTAVVVQEEEKKEEATHTTGKVEEVTTVEEKLTSDNIITDQKKPEEKKKESKTPEQIEEEKRLILEESEKVTAMGMSMPSIAGAVSHNISLADFYSENGGYYKDETILSVGGGSNQNIDDAKTALEATLDDWKNSDTKTFTTNSKKSKNKKKKKVSNVDVSIVFSGWNPPPPNRQMMGDLMYLIVETSNTEHHVTACPLGFYINSTYRDTFNPSPAAPVSLSSTTTTSQGGSNNNNSTYLYHDLLDLIKKISPSFEKMYQQTVKHNQTIEQFSSPNSVLSDVWDALLSVPGTKTGPSHQWNVYVPTENNNNDTSLSKSSKSSKTSKMEYNHSYDMNRAENDLTDTFGMDERGALRDWNEEYQQSKELPFHTVQDRLVRARTLYKHQTDFVNAARCGAEAIINGHVLSINPMDEPSARVYVFNNIFFSLSVPGAGRDAAHDGTEEATTAAVVSSTFESRNDKVPASKHDLHGNLAMNMADIPGLHTLATVVVDYMGQRVVAQSIIPGILQGEHNSKLVYGSIDGGITIASDPVMHDLMKQASKHLLVGERIVTPLGHKEKESSEGEQKKAKVLEERALQTCADTKPVPLCGPVDCKGMEGCDGRHYVLDLVNMLPVDANWTKDLSKIKSNPATSKSRVITSSGISRAPKGCRESLCLLRPELVRQYANWKISKAKDVVIQQHHKKLKEREVTAKKKAEEGGEQKDTEDTKKANAETKEEDKKESAALRAALVKAMVPPLVNPNVFSKHKYTDVTTSDDETKTTIEKDEEMIDNICSYLIEFVIPNFLRDVKLSNLLLVDGSSLITTMHQRGINVRYLGHMASIWIQDYNLGRDSRLRYLQQQQVKQQEEENEKNGTASSKKEAKGSLPKIVLSDEDDVRRSYFLRLAEIEMIARTVRHKISTLLRENQNIMVAPGAIIATFLSKMMTKKGGLGYKQDDEKSNEEDIKHDSYFTPSPAFDFTVKAGSKFIPSTGREMWNDITRDVYSKFRYNLHVWPGQYEDTTSQTNNKNRRSILMDIDRIALLRRVCQLLGISIKSRKYDFDSISPIDSTDIHNMLPIMKDGFTKCQMKDIVELIEYGRSCLNKRQLNEAHIALSEALVYLYQVVGVMHEYVAVACSLLAQTYYAGSNIEQAILFEQRALCLYERMGGGSSNSGTSGSSSGYDSYQVIHSHNFLATLYSKLKFGHKMAAKHMVRYLYLQRIACGQYHSDMNNSLIKLGNIYQSIGRLDQACKAYQYALSKSIPNTINFGTCLHLLAKVFYLGNQHEDALTHVREVSYILLLDSYYDPLSSVTICLHPLPHCFSHPILGI
jgi:protein TIF31